jgi:hypothetical protein
VKGSLVAGWQWLAEAPRKRLGVRVLQALLGAFLLFRVGTELPYAPLLWGPGGWAAPEEGASGSAQALASLFSSDARVHAALALQAVGGALLVLGRVTRLATLAALVPYWLLYNRLPGFGDAGDNLARLLLAYLLLFAPPGEACGPVRTWLHNLGVIVVSAQLCLVYFSAAVLKTTGTVWLDGTATYLVAQNELLGFTPGNPLFDIPAVLTFSSYGMLLLQAWYPLAQLSALRRPWLALIMGFHAWTAVTMGIYGFAAVMISANLFMLRDAELAALGARVQGLARRAAAAWRPGPARPRSSIAPGE